MGRLDRLLGLAGSASASGSPWWIPISASSRPADRGLTTVARLGEKEAVMIVPLLRREAVVSHFYRGCS